MVSGPNIDRNIATQSQVGMHMVGGAAAAAASSLFAKNGVAVATFAAVAKQSLPLPIRPPSPNTTQILRLACEYGDTVTLASLLDEGMEVNQLINGKSLLMLATSKGQDAAVRLLIRAKADPDQADEEGKTPLSVATKNGHNDILHMLLQTNADVNKADRKENSPLHRAAQAGSPPIVRIFLDAGAIPRAVNVEHKTPLDVAKTRNHREVENILTIHLTTVDAAFRMRLQILCLMKGESTKMIMNEDYENEDKKECVALGGVADDLIHLAAEFIASFWLPME